MRLFAVICFLAMLSACNQVANIQAYSNGRCTGSTYSSTLSPDSNIQILQSRDGSTATCTIKFEVTK